MTADAPANASPARGLVLDLSQSGFAAVLDASDLDLNLETGPRVLAYTSRPIEARGARDDLAGWLEGLLAETGADFKNLAWICAGLGPGSFTGIRMALAFVQGLAMPRAIPLYGFTAFEALFLSFPEASHANPTLPAPVAAVAANAGRFYLSTGLQDEGVLGDAAALAALAVAGKGADRPVLLIPAAGPAFETAGKDFAAVLSAQGAWNAGRIARHARASGRGLERPHYLQASAAEDAQALQKKKAEEAAKAAGAATA